MIRLRGMSPTTLMKAFLAGRRTLPNPRHVFLCIADHFEPEWRNASVTLQHERVDRWASGYGPSVDGLGDSRGRPPQHTFFYPVECYSQPLVEKLAGIARSGFGDVEIHLHHDNDHPDSLRETLSTSCERFAQNHGLLSRDATGQLRYGFVHGNWSLDNSHPDGRWCGVNNELTILRETGCYADLTMPAAPHPAQTRTINQIYYAVDDPERPKSHDTGTAVSRGASQPVDSLLMIQGPLVLRTSLQRPRFKLENGNLSRTQPPSASRLYDWLRAEVAVRGREDWLFIKLHTHGAQESITDVLLGAEMRRLHESLKRIADERGFHYYYVTARELAQLVRQAQSAIPAPDFEKLSW